MKDNFFVVFHMETSQVACIPLEALGVTVTARWYGRKPIPTTSHARHVYS